MSNTYQVRLTTDLQDLTPILAGASIRSADTYNTPRPPTFTLLHYVTQGSGVFSAKGVTYEVKAGQAFLILPGEKYFITKSLTLIFLSSAHVIVD